MIPRRDPETRPVAVGFQITKRGPANRYGTELRTDKMRVHRPIQTRNGLPVPCYDPANRPNRLPPDARRKLDRAWAYNQRWPAVAAAARLTTTSAAATTTTQEG